MGQFKTFFTCSHWGRNFFFTTKQQSIAWIHKGLLPSKKFKIQKYDDKGMAVVFYDNKAILYTLNICHKREYMGYRRQQTLFLRNEDESWVKKCCFCKIMWLLIPLRLQGMQFQNRGLDFLAVHDRSGH